MCCSQMLVYRFIIILLLQTETLDAVEFNVTVSYESAHFKKGTYRMDVTAYKQEFIFPIPQGSDTTSFELTGKCEAFFL